MSATLQIEENAVWLNYIEDAYDGGKEMCLLGTYFGSSTRNHTSGEVVVNDKMYEKHIRIISDGNRIAQFHITRGNIENTMNNWKLSTSQLYPTMEVYDPITNLNAVVHLRDLHRFPEHPFEISGICIKF